MFLVCCQAGWFFFYTLSDFSRLHRNKGIFKAQKNIFKMQIRIVFPMLIFCNLQSSLKCATTASMSCTAICPKWSRPGSLFSPMINSKLLKIIRNDNIQKSLIFLVHCLWLGKLARKENCVDVLAPSTRCTYTRDYVNMPSLGKPNNSG